MPRAKENKLYRTFTKGLVTEASPLTYPEDASIDELNTVISRKGNRTRRNGIDFEQDYVLTDVSLADDKVVQTHSWLSINNKASLAFVVVQVGTRIFFYNLQADAPVSASRMPFSINLIDYRVASAPSNDISRTAAEFSSGFGLLFIAHKYIDPIVVEYNETDNTITATKITIQVRDVEGVYDGLANDAEPATLSKEHFYNLRNQGWVPPGTRGNTSDGGGGTVVNSSPAVSYWDAELGRWVKYYPGGGIAD